jgi:hypothetical protein
LQVISIQSDKGVPVVFDIGLFTFCHGKPVEPRRIDGVFDSGVKIGCFKSGYYGKIH